MTDSYAYITQYKVYDLIEYIKRDEYSDVIIIESDIGLKVNCVINTQIGIELFKDVTEEYRNELIDDILL